MRRFFNTWNKCLNCWIRKCSKFYAQNYFLSGPVIQYCLFPVCRFVDKAIKATVIGHLFGDESSLLNASIDTTVREDQTEPGKHTYPC